MLANESFCLAESEKSLTSINLTLDRQTLQWLEDNDIYAVDCADKSWPDSGSSVFWLIESTGRQLYLKQFSSAAKFSNEVRAYCDWLPQLTLPVPTLVAYDETLRTLVVTNAGKSVDDFKRLSPKSQRELMKQAGDFLRQLHHVQFVDDDSMLIGDAFRLRAERCRETLHEYPPEQAMISLQTVDVMVAELEEVVADLNGYQRVPCHRDFWQRNWVTFSQPTNDEAVMAVIDFEHAQPDLFLFDFMKMWSDLWLDDRQLEEIFWGSYGWSPDDHTRELMRRCGRLHALQTIAWACQHDDDFLAHGMKLINATSR